jgi:hypothetical protein
MSEVTTPDRDEEMLARLAEFDLAAAERVHGRLMAAEETSDIAELGRTYQRIARSLRQTLALKAKLKRDRETAQIAGAKDAPPRAPGGVAVVRRIRELRTAVARVIWAEAESPDHGTTIEAEFEDLVAHEMSTDAFCEEPLDDHVARICLDLNLLLENIGRWRDLPDPPDDEAADPDEAPKRMSSG